jgi:hypothetical protein
MDQDFHNTEREGWRGRSSSLSLSLLGSSFAALAVLLRGLLLLLFLLLSLGSLDRGRALGYKVPQLSKCL